MLALRLYTQKIRRHSYKYLDPRSSILNYTSAAAGQLKQAVTLLLLAARRPPSTGIRFGVIGRPPKLETMMDSVEGVVSRDARSASRQARLLPERRNAVATACQEAIAATDTFLSLLDEAAPSDKSAAERARLQFEMTLSVYRCASCEGLADIREKCRTFRRLEELLSPSDPRLQPVASNLVQEMADFLEDEDVF